MILAKNSDREPNEAQNITFVPAARHPRGSMVRCTYGEVPQAERTYACLLSRPFWMWGAEMGVNEKGVAIGNEAVFTKERYSKTGLTGMDMLRLALERSASALEALALITELLDTYGQGGNCGYDSSLYYHNSFLIADAGEAYILETADKQWVAKKVTGTASISNCLTLGEDFTIHSPDLEEYARNKRYLKAGKRLNFARDFSDRLYTHFAKGRVRQSCSSVSLAIQHGKITSLDMFALLRNHNMPEPYCPGESPMERICLHAGGLISTQSTGSMVAVLRKKRPPLVYFTGTSAPCLSLFKPHVLTEGQKKYAENHFTAHLDDGAADLYGTASGEFDARTLWWTGERIHRRALVNYGELAPAWQHERDALEREMAEQVEETWRGGLLKSLPKKCGASVKVFLDRNAVVAGRMEQLSKSVTPSAPAWYRLFWKRINRKARFVM
jgi:dipeptidase